MNGFDVSAFLAHCADLAAVSGPLWLGLFLAGLVGSASHCAFMCGPFVLAQQTARLATLKPGQGEWRRLAGAALLPYHFGRMTIYVALGAALAMPVAGLGALSASPWLPALALIAAGLVFAGFGLRGMRAWIGVPPSGTGTALPLGNLAERLADRARPFFADPAGWRGYALGLMLGFLPCGLLYAALTAAAATADPGAAAFGMAAFALGTMPMLWAIAYLGERIARRWRKGAERAMPAIALANAVLLFALAWRLLFP